MDAPTLADSIGVPVRAAEPMARHNSWRVGGPADRLVLARSREPEAWFGRPASRALRGGGAGSFSSGDDGGVHSYLAHTRAAMAGWTVAVDESSLRQVLVNR